MIEILIIEDEKSDFEIIKESISKLNYETFPLDMDSFNEMKKNLVRLKQNKRNLIEFAQFQYVKKLLDKHSFSLIICDLKILNTLLGVDIIRYVRNRYEKTGDPLYNTMIPIIALTKHSTKQFAIDAINAGAYQHKKYFPNGKVNIFEEKKFLTSLQYYIDIYINKSKFDKLLSPIYTEYKELLIQHNFLIECKFDNIELMIKGNHKETMNTLDILFNTSFQTLDSNKKDKLLKDYEIELINMLGQDKFDKLKKTKWQKFKEAFNDMNQGGGFKEMADCAYDMVNDSGVLESIPAGKIAGRLFTGIIGVLST